MVEATELKKVEFFKVFDESQLKLLAGITERKSYARYQRVYEKGERANHLFVVTRGLISLREFKAGDQVGIAFESRERGEFFGTACFMKPQQYTLTCVCLEDSEVLAVDANALIELCETHPDLGYGFMKRVAQLYFERYKLAKRQIHEMVKGATIITALPG